MNNPKLIRADAKLKNLPEEDLQTLWRLRHPEQGGEVMTLEAICVEVQRLFGFSIALSSLSQFYTWLEVRRRMDAQAELANQLKLELARNPEISDETIKRAGQKLFMAEGILQKDAKIFADMVIIGQNDTRLKQNDAKIKQRQEVVELDKRKLAILEAKAAKADQASEVTNSDLTEEEKAARIKRIFRMG
jgi:hypothetical protein